MKIKSILTLLFISLVYPLLSQDKIFTKSGDTLNVLVKNIDKKAVVFMDSKSNKESILEVDKLYKILWRNGKEYIIDQSFENELLKKSELTTKPKNSNVIDNFSLPKVKPILNEITDSKARVDSSHKVNAQELTPKLSRHWRLFYFVYKVDSKRVEKKEFIETAEKFDFESSKMITEGIGQMGKGWLNVGIGFGALYLNKNIVYSSPELQRQVRFPIYLYMVFYLGKRLRGRRISGEGIDLFNKKLMANSLNPNQSK